MNGNFKLIGRRVKEARQLHNLSQAQLAELIDMSVSFISHIETAKKQASLESLVRITNALGITVDELLTGNQLYDCVEYQTDFDLLISDCSSYEKRVIFEMVNSIKISLRANIELIKFDINLMNNNS